mgnify:CR=1
MSDESITKIAKSAEVLCSNGDIFSIPVFHDKLKKILRGVFTGESGTLHNRIIDHITPSPITLITKARL